VPSITGTPPRGSSDVRETYIISDLHLGGRSPGTAAATDPGFQICTQGATIARFVRDLACRRSSDMSVELVINGDFVDFLTEPSADSNSWTSLHSAESAALAFQRVCEREEVVFSALEHFLSCGNRLVMTLGNHDLELTFPIVRRLLRERLKVVGGTDFEFVFDGEAYTVCNALIEHGNRYDRYNQVDHDAFRRFRSQLSRGLDVARLRPPAPVGSRLVSEVINPLKEKYRFIDLLKPENEGMLPLLLALEPATRTNIARALQILMPGTTHGLRDSVTPFRAGEIGAHATSLPVYPGDLVSMTNQPPSQAGVLTQELRKTMSTADSELFMGALFGPAGRGLGEIGSYDQLRGLLQLLAYPSSDFDARLGVLMKAIQVLHADKSFELTSEADEPYVSAARTLMRDGGFKFVIFGHTHLAKKIDLEGGAYLNSGTWANLMRFPNSIFGDDQDVANKALREFVMDVGRNDIEKHLDFRPTYVRLVSSADQGVVQVRGLI
jgi:UDP-2,3-diacylglucosamine pyrophosphatase LpxH